MIRLAREIIKNKIGLFLRLTKIPALIVLAFLAVGSISIGIIESNDSFCASCHAQPEKKYYFESLKKKPETLAAFHTKKKTNCIDCHSRSWFTGRFWAQLGGISNLITYLSRSEEKYFEKHLSKTTRPVGTSGCTKCHSEFFWGIERPGHYHSPQIQKLWQKAGGPFNTCEACHPSHKDNSNQKNKFMQKKLIKKQCDSCHKAIEKR